MRVDGRELMVVGHPLLPRDYASQSQGWEFNKVTRGFVQKGRELMNRLNSIMTAGLSSTDSVAFRAPAHVIQPLCSQTECRL